MGANKKKKSLLYVPPLGLICFIIQLECMLGQTLKSTLMISIYGTGGTNGNSPLSDANVLVSSNFKEFEYNEYFVTDSSREVSEEAPFNTSYLPDERQSVIIIVASLVIVWCCGGVREKV